MAQIAYSAPEVAQLLGISKSAAYNLMRHEDFPSFQIGRRWLIQESCLNEWIEKQPDISRITAYN